MTNRPRTLYEKIWDAHTAAELPTGETLLYIDRHLVHEVTSPQAYEGLRAAGRKPWRVDSIVATVRSGWRTFRPRARSPANAWGLVTSWTR